MSGRPDELHDSEAELSAPGPLGEYLRLCREHLVRPYRNADRAALRNQSWHRWIARLTGVLGAAALTIAGYNIAFEASSATFAIEAALAATAAVCVIGGLVGEWHEQWLVARYRAEQLRLVKFRFLVDPEFWCEGVSSAVSQARFSGAIRRIEAVEAEHLSALAEDEEVPALPSAAICERLDERLRRGVLDYYRRRRLDYQIDYFASRAERDARRWYEKPRLLPLVFFLSVALAVTHALFELASHRSAPARAGAVARSAEGARDSEAAMARYALAASLWIPAAWAGVRTYRTANEFGRNKSRSLAKSRALAKISERLRPEAPAADAFSDMGLCEYILATDQGEWLRLMKEAEWYG